MHFERNSVTCFLVASVCLIGAPNSDGIYEGEIKTSAILSRTIVPRPEGNIHSKMSPSQQADFLLPGQRRSSGKTRYHIKRDTNKVMGFQRRIPCGTMSLEVIPEAAVLKGEDAQMKWPWMVMVIGQSNTCGGVLITSQWVLTAAHCIDHTRSLILGRQRLRHWPTYARRRAAIKEIKHPWYDKFSFQHDIGLIKMDRPVYFNKHVQPVCLPTYRNYFRTGELCFLTGWGTRQAGTFELASILQQLKTDVISQFECSLRWMFGGKMIRHGQICTDFDSSVEGSGICKGDSGSPLNCKMDGVFYVAGIASFMISGCRKGFFPDVFTRVSFYEDWITRTVIHNS